MQNYEPACETGEIKDEIKRQAFISTSISCKYFALTILLIGGRCLWVRKPESVFSAYKDLVMSSINNWWVIEEKIASPFNFVKEAQ